MDDCGSTRRFDSYGPLLPDCKKVLLGMRRRVDRERGCGAEGAAEGAVRRGARRRRAPRAEANIEGACARARAAARAHVHIAPLSARRRADKMRPQCTWGGRQGWCADRPDDVLGVCEGCSDAFHNVCAINNVYELFKGRQELQDVGDNKCGRCGPWLLLETPAVEHMSVDEEESPRCVIADLAVVRKGTYPCLDRVLCCVPGCA